MTSKEFHSYLLDVVTRKQAQPSWRIGQTYMNVLGDKYPEIAETYIGGHLDPFYVDDIVPKFLEDLYQHHVKEGR